MPTRRLFVTTLATAAALFTAVPAFALGALVEVQLVDRAQRDTLPTYAARGATWVAGRPGSRYAVRLTNRSGARVLVVLSVDGVNAVSGETAAADQTGYVLGPYQTTEITGWRKSLTEAAAFYFTALPDSYAARTDRPDNVGVIGAAVFRERVDEAALNARRRLEAERSAQAARGAAEPESSAAAQAPAALPASPSAALGKTAPMRDERLGTGHGEREYAPTTQVAFERASETPTEIVRLRYDSRANLVASGVIRPPRHVPSIAPDPFPASFVPDPKG
ncbi:MAG TPA: hypothetical protein VGM74_07055 [Burkholderiaceae bacterium]|jgi:hypothetical protein